MALVSHHQSATDNSSAPALSPQSGIKSSTNAFGKKITAYYNSLPNDILYNTGVSFVGSFLLGTAYSGNVAVGLVAGLVGALSTLIHSVTGPIFAFISEKCGRSSSQIDWWLELIRRIVVVTLVAGLVSFATVYSVNLLFTAVLTGVTMFANNGTLAPYSVNNAMIFLVA